MKLIISRTYGKSETKGLLLLLNEVKVKTMCVTLELANNGNQKFTSCIPEGKYKVEKYWSPTKGECFKVLDVPGRDNILIHKGNYANGAKVDTKGCILVGYAFNDINKDGFIDITESTITMELLLKLIPDKIDLYII
jgi:hypothetical protein